MKGRLWGTFNGKRFIKPTDLFFKPFESHLEGIEHVLSSNDHTACLGIKKGDTKKWIYTLGNNSNGECGRPGKEKYFLPVPVVVNPQHTLDAIGGMYTGRSQLFAVDETRQQVYGTGLNDYGQLGIADQMGKKVTTLTFIDELSDTLAKKNHEVLSIVNKGSFTLVLTQHREDPSDQALFASGANHHHELNHACKPYSTFKDLLPYYRKYTKALNNVEIAEISCGNTHVVLLTRCHRLFSRGRGKEGQLGTPKDPSVNPMHAMHFIEHAPLEEPLYNIRSGFHYNVALGKDTKNVYCWGAGVEGHRFWGNPANGQQLATPNSHPIKVIYESKPDDPVVQLAAGSQHVLFRTTSSQLFSYGTGFDGELCDEKQGQHIDHPILVPLTKGTLVSHVFAGDGFSGCLGQFCD